MHKRPALLLIAIAVLGFAWQPQPLLAQSEEEQARAQLKQLQRDIRRIDQEISSANQRKNTLQRQLRDAEIELGNVQRSIAGNRKAIGESQQELAALEAKQAELLAARSTQQARIATELRTAWQMSRQGQVKVLLNQESPHTVARATGYYRYFFQARNKLLSQYRATLDELTSVEEGISATLQQLASQQTALTEQQAKLESAQANRKLAVAKLNDSIADKGQTLEQLQRDRKELESLLQAIEEAVVNLRVPDNYQPFNKARGKMPWPLAAKASNRYGRARNEGKMRWQGLVFPAAEGTQVNAIHHGRVVYSDWLRGSGLLLIIDHGDGYMSLYAHNQSLLRDVGEWVTAGTPVSTVGSSGGRESPGLYFEIRHNGKPTDPGKWCRG
tara:strand:- start:316612 stop:317769 length:1158 start_codon:yes stop_codon:yes gene_type:complete